MPKHSRFEKEYNIEGTSALIADFNSPLAVVITHPWGPLGGNPHNNVVNAVALYFQKLGVTTMRIGFKGSQVGRGLNEVKEVLNATTFLISGQHLSQADDGDGTIEFGESKSLGSSPENNGEDHKRVPTGILLIGYSYGALISASASASIRQCVGFAAIAPPFGVKHWLLLFNSEYHMERAKVRHFPRLLMQGSRDNFTTERKFSLVVESFPKGTTGAVLKNADHHFVGREGDVMNIIGQWLIRAYPALGGEIKNLPATDLWAQTVLEHVQDDNSIGAQSTVSDKDAGTGALSFMSRFYECADTYPCRSTQI